MGGRGIKYQKFLIDLPLNILFTIHIAEIVHGQSKEDANMATAREKTARKKSPAANRKAAASKRNALIARLKTDLKATKEALQAATKGARIEIKLTRSATKAEIAVLKDQLAAARKREQALAKLGEKKARMMLAAGERWEREQLVKIRKMVEKTRRKVGAR